MTKLTAGTVIVARYELNEQVTYPDANVKMWHAKDKIFARDVNLFSVSDFDEETAAGALERARETAQVSIAGIARVLDVLESGSTKVIVTERASGVSAQTAISGSTFMVDQARAVVGTVAQNLVKASEKGLHHGNLSAQSVWFDVSKITVDGIVARHIVNANADLTPEELVNHDILGLSALLYFMLTGVMPQYPNTENDLPRLLTVVPRMTTELESLSMGVLNGTHPAPTSIAAFLAELGEWTPDDLPVVDPEMLADLTEVDEDTASTTAIPPQRASFKAALKNPSTPGTVPPAPPVEKSATSAVPLPGAGGPAFGAMAPATSPKDTSGGTPPTPKPAGTTARRRFHFNPTALILVVALVVLVWGGTWAYNTLTADFEPITVAPTGRPTPSPTETEESGEDKPAEPTKEPAKIVLPVIAGAKSLDPEGDENEHPELQDKLFDGDSSTAWYSRTYKTAPFSNLKSGIGIALSLEEKSTVSSVLISSANKGGMVEVRATTADKPKEGEVLASGPLDGETLFTLSKPTETESIVLWFTLMPKDQNGNNRFYFYEIALT